MRTAVLALAIAACTPAADTAGTTSELTGTCRDTRLPWGSDAGEVGLSPAVPESLATGPLAAAIAPTGDVLVLDQLNARVIAIDPRGDVRTVAELPRDAEELAVGEDGAFAIYSPLRSHAWWFESDGRPAGELAIDRTLRHVVGIELATSRRLVLHTAYQERFVVGSPSAPVALATVLSGKREGTALLPDGRGVATRASSGRAELVVLTNPPGRKSQIAQLHSLPGSADAAMVVGTTGTIACLRVEQLAAQRGDVIDVRRRAVCLDVATGRVVTDLPLAKPGIYQPRHDLAVAGSTLAVLDAQPDALVVRTCEVVR